ncbi:MAG: hypothetical protein ACRDHN_20275 [Thermomicrobiales bacterium]
MQTTATAPPEINAGEKMDAQAVIWFIIAAAAAFGGLKLLYERFVVKKTASVESRGGTTLFALCMILFALGALAAGLVSAM